MQERFKEIDVTVIDRHFNGNFKIYERIVERFITQSEGTIARIKVLFDTWDREGFMLALRVIRELSNNVGAVRLSQTAESIEAMAKAGDSTSVGLWLGELEKDYLCAIGALTDSIKKDAV